jgi:N-acetylmuramoyl-L-alanine amidase
MATKPSIEFSKERIRGIFTARGWRQVGYSEVINQDGSIHDFIDHNGDDFIQASEVTNGVRGWNRVSKHISYAGGVREDDHTVPEDTRTVSQYLKMAELIFEEIKAHPDIKVCGHNQFPNVSKACPSFSVEDFIDELNDETKLRKRLESYGVEEWYIESYIQLNEKIEEKNIVRGKIS